MRALSSKHTPEKIRMNLTAVLEAIEKYLSDNDALEGKNETSIVLVETKEHILKVVNYLNDLQLPAPYIDHFGRMASTFMSLTGIRNSTNGIAIPIQKERIEAGIDAMEVTLIDEIRTLKYFETIGFTLKNLSEVAKDFSQKLFQPEVL